MLKRTSGPPLRAGKLGLAVLAVLEGELLWPLTDARAENRSRLRAMHDVATAIPWLAEPRRPIRLIGGNQSPQLGNAGLRQIQREGEEPNLTVGDLH
jgi:hypothetical protein